MEDYEKDASHDKEARREEYERKHGNGKEDEEYVPGPFKRRPLGVDNGRWKEDWQDEIYEDEEETIPNIWD